MSSHNDSRPTRTGDVVRVVVVAVSAALALVGSFVGSGAAGGTPIQDAAGGALAADATLIAPGTQAFSIWTVIYLGLVGYTVWQLLPGQRATVRQRRIGYPMAVSMLLNAGWILSIQAGLLWLSIPIIVVLLVDLGWIFARLHRPSGPAGWPDAVLVDGTVGLYLGWVCVATAADITAVLVAAGFGGFGLAPPVWAAIVIAVAGAVGVWLAVCGAGRLAPTLSLCWGLAWIAVARLTGQPLSTSTAVTAIVVVAIVLAATVLLRLQNTKPAGAPENARTR